MRLLPWSPANDRICSKKPILHLILTELSGAPSPQVQPDAAQTVNSQAVRTSVSWQLACSRHLSNLAGLASQQTFQLQHCTL